jgi:hypothetical protein
MLHVDDLNFFRKSTVPIRIGGAAQPLRWKESTGETRN